MKINELFRSLIVVSSLGFVLSIQGCIEKSPSTNAKRESIRLITLDPGHFHAALVQKSMLSGVDSNVYVYAPEGQELKAHLALIDRYNSRDDDPTSWNEKVHVGDDYFEKMLAEKPGDVVILAGNNKKKTQYILESIEGGLNVLSDKPMAISNSNFEMLKTAFSRAEESNLLLYDIMTERYEINAILQKEFLHSEEIFGELKKGTLEDPAIIKKSAHYYYKEVSGAPLIRPIWYYDVEQEGDGLVDIPTHMVDLIQWQVFPEVALDYKTDINMVSASRWPTRITQDQYRQSTKAESFPEFLNKDVKDGVLHVFANGEMNYTIKGVHAKVSVEWGFQAPEGSGDTHLSMMHGTKANLAIRQGAEQGYKPVLFIEPINGEFSDSYIKSLNSALLKIQEKYPGVEFRKSGSAFEVAIPDTYKEGHEAHFAKVAEKYLQYLKKGDMPAWEVPNMLAKYYTTTQALEKALKK